MVTNRRRSGMSLCREHAIFHHNDPVGHVFYIGGIVCDEYDGSGANAISDESLPRLSAMVPGCWK